LPLAATLITLAVIALAGLYVATRPETLPAAALAPDDWPNA